MKPHYELLIIGGGPAGMTAAIYATRRKIDTLLVTKAVGGQTAWSADIENYPGFTMITGPDLTTQFLKHVKRFDDDNATFDLEVTEGVEVVHLESVPTGWLAKLSSGQVLTARAVIVAAGKTPRMLNIPGEQQLLGRGVTFCATCDAPLYKGKVVAVVGGGNSALDATLQLRKICPKVYLITINPELTGEQVMVDAVKASPNVTVLTERDAVEVVGSNQVTGLKVKQRKTGTVEELAVGGIFEEIGYEPATGFLQGVIQLNQAHEVVIDTLNQTSAPGIFAAGDITTVPEKQIVVAAGEGAKAALQAYAYLMRNTAT
jgi:alkyl hydroperoxide reductase subunit F